MYGVALSGAVVEKMTSVLSAQAIGSLRFNAMSVIGSQL